jgi:hypothetical protein
MNRDKLKIKLDELGISSKDYSLYGKLDAETNVLKKINTHKWQVFKLDERCGIFDLYSFDTEDAACNYFYLLKIKDKEMSERIAYINEKARTATIGIPKQAEQTFFHEMDMNNKLKEYLGQSVQSVLLEFSCFDNFPPNLINVFFKIEKLYVGISSFYVSISTQQEKPITQSSGLFVYEIKEKKIDWLQVYKIFSIKFLLDELNTKKGILFCFENGHNIAIYRNYFNENIFVTDIDIDEIIYTPQDIQPARADL